MIIKPEELKIVYEKEDDGRTRPVYFIDAEPVRHGKWLKNDGSYRFDKNAYPKCSVCGGVEFLGYRKKYCPNCGAKMDGGRRTDADE